jgi:uncharacterized membrane protein
MTVDVVTEIVIARPRDQVAAFSADPDNAPKWYANIKSVEWISQPPLRLGSRVAFVAKFLGRRLAYTYEMVEFDLPHRLVMRTSEGPFPMETTYVWVDAAAGGTLMSLANRGEPTGFSALAAPLMASAMKQANRKDLQLLKSLLEDE